MFKAKFTDNYQAKNVVQKLDSERLIIFVPELVTFKQLDEIVEELKNGALEYGLDLETAKILLDNNFCSVDKRCVTPSLFTRLVIRKPNHMDNNYYINSYNGTQEKPQ